MVGTWFLSHFKTKRKHASLLEQCCFFFFTILFCLFDHYLGCLLVLVFMNMF